MHHWSCIGRHQDKQTQKPRPEGKRVHNPLQRSPVAARLMQGMPLPLHARQLNYKANFYLNKYFGLRTLLISLDIITQTPYKGYQT